MLKCQSAAVPCGTHTVKTYNNLDFEVFISWISYCVLTCYHEMRLTSTKVALDAVSWTLSDEKSCRKWETCLATSFPSSWGNTNEAHFIRHLSTSLHGFLGFGRKGPHKQYWPDFIQQDIRKLGCGTHCLLLEGASAFAHNCSSTHRRTEGVKQLTRRHHVWHVMW